MSRFGLRMMRAGGMVLCGLGLLGQSENAELVLLWFGMTFIGGWLCGVAHRELKELSAPWR